MGAKGDFFSEIAFQFYVTSSGKWSFYLTHEESSASYVIICHNVRTYQSAGVIAVVRGKQVAEATLKNLECSQSSTDRHEGWRYFIERSNLKAGTDPAEATHLRQSELDVRESKALQATDSSGLRTSRQGEFGGRSAKRARPQHPLESERRYFR